MSNKQRGNSEAEICPFLCRCREWQLSCIKKLFLSGDWLTSGEWRGGGGWERLVYRVGLFAWEFFRAGNKALTSEESRCHAPAGVMRALVTRAPPNEDESQCAPRLPGKH